ncbi:MAG TPA: LLM class flavin-dependent oxidoreductase [Solirubrobacteraceae bacterium]|nr:LLM class flavin-dependent oxidoreductase [Solirubrobacteraceae bacterium]
MKVSLAIGFADDPAAAAAEAEAAGFDGVHCGEHLFMRVPIQHSLTALAVAAGATERVRLISSVTLLPLCPAAVIAKIATTVDVASGGRLELGLGLGGEFPAEFSAVGAKVSERGARADEGLAVLRALFTGERVDFEGRWATLEGVRLQPPPAQPGGPRLWLAGRKGAALRRVARYGDVWLPYMVTPEMFADGLATVREAAGRPVTGAVMVFINVDRDGDRARTEAAAFTSNTYGQPPSVFERYVVGGTPEECVAQIKAYEDAGAEWVLLSVAAPADRRAHVTRLATAEVLPAL